MKTGISPDGQECAGNVDGEEPNQLYTCDEFASTPRPIKELKAYRRVTLQPPYFIYPSINQLSTKIT
jgi:hypothetical protein